MDVSYILWCLLLGITAVLGDFLVQLHQHDDIRRALFDNVTHAAIGVLTWINVWNYVGRVRFFGGETLAQSVICGLISSLIDLDHFILARSFHLKDATNLSRRPFLHCTTLPVTTFILMLLVSYILQNSNLKLYGWILMASFLSHHTRDAARRGFWLWPLGSTPPLGNGLYLVLTMLLPFMISMGINFTSTIMTSRGQSDSFIV